MKKLVRDNTDKPSIELTGKKFNTVVLDNIVSTVQQIKERTNAEDILVDAAEVLELLNAYLISENIKSQDVLAVANELRTKHGSYSKKLVIKE